MALKLMYITNSTEVAQIAEAAGVDRIFVDMEYIGKAERQGGMDTVQSHHTIQDIRNVKSVVKTSEVIVRINPIHEESTQYCSSEEEINGAIVAGADILMLPYFKTSTEVRKFIKAVASRVKTMLLIETPEAVSEIDEILDIEGVDEVLIGLNDLSLGYHKKFMFELLTDGTVENLCMKFRLKGIPYGFGGIASLGKGQLPAEYIIKEHYRLGSTCVILSRSFCNLALVKEIDEVDQIFAKSIQAIRRLEKECQTYSNYFAENSKIVAEKVKQICDNIE